MRFKEGKGWQMDNKKAPQRLAGVVAVWVTIIPCASRTAYISLSLQEYIGPDAV